jgi:hypothetical protein
MKRSIQIAYRFRRALALMLAACGFGVLYFAAQALGLELKVAGISDEDLRPIAHFCVFGTLAVMIAQAVWSQYLLAWLLAVVLATGEEMHQLFVPYRYAGVGDWLINVAGITVFLIVAKIALPRLMPRLVGRLIPQPA